jgi:protein gp37
VGETTKISWCDHTFNPWRGCTPVSAGCDHCYAKNDLSVKLHGIKWGPNAERRIKADSGWRDPRRWNKAAEQAGERRRVFVGSLCDVFEDNPQVEDARRRLIELIEKCQALDWLLLTKRPENIGPLWHRAVGSMDCRGLQFAKNVWLGVTVENQEAADARMPILCRIPARVRFLSMEPLLGPVRLGLATACDRDCSEYQNAECPGTSGPCIMQRLIEWAIVGGESGPRCRPCEVDWIRSAVQQCREADVPVWVKQIGGHPDKRDQIDDLPAALRIRRLPRIPE